MNEDGLEVGVRVKGVHEFVGHLEESASVFSSRLAVTLVEVCRCFDRVGAGRAIGRIFGIILIDKPTHREEVMDELEVCCVMWHFDKNLTMEIPIDKGGFVGLPSVGLGDGGALYCLALRG
jgi:hypothetical protein